jgi:hypothetical protein
MEPLLVPLCAILFVAALLTVSVGKSRALSRARGGDGSHEPPSWRDRRWRPRRPVVFEVRRRPRADSGPRIVIPKGKSRL